MPLTKVAIIYSKNQNRRREIIKSVIDDSHIDRHKNRMVSGEGWLEIPLDVYNKFSHPDHIDRHIEKILGAKASSHKCAVVDNNNNIIEVVCADPSIDEHPLGVLIQDDYAVSGAIYDFINSKVI